METSSINTKSEIDNLLRKKRKKINSQDSNFILSNLSNKKSHKKKKKLEENFGIETIDDDSKFVKSPTSILNHSKLQIKEVFLYKPYCLLPSLSSYVGELIEVKISSEFICLSNNVFKESRIWGNEIYSSDSDAVLVLQHSGFVEVTDTPPDQECVSLFLRVGKGRMTYNSVDKNNVQSRKSISYQGHSIKPEGFCFSKLGTLNELIDLTLKLPYCKDDEKNFMINNRPAVSIVPYNRGSEKLLCFNMCFELCYRYDLSQLCDIDEVKGRNEYLSYKLKSAVLYIETNDQRRFEISRINDVILKKKNIKDYDSNSTPSNEESLRSYSPIKIKTETDQTKNFDPNSNSQPSFDIKNFLNYCHLFDEHDRFRIKEVINPTNKNLAWMNSTPSIPLTSQHTKSFCDYIDWSEIHWGLSSIEIRGVFIQGITNYKLIDRK